MLFAVLSTEPVRFTESLRRLSNKLSQTPLAWWPSAGWSVARARVSLQTRRVLQRGERNVPEAPPVAWVWGKAEMTLEPSLSARAVVGWGRSGRHVHRRGQRLQTAGRDGAAGGPVRASGRGWFPAEAGPSCRCFGRRARGAQVGEQGSETGQNKASPGRVEEQSRAVASAPLGASGGSVEHTSGVTQRQSPSATSCQSWPGLLQGHRLPGTSSQPWAQDSTPGL